MNSKIETRLAKLEAARLIRPEIGVVEAQVGSEDEAADRYLAGIPEERQPELLVVVRRFAG